MFLFGDFIHHKDCLTYSDGSDRPGELCYNFSTSKDLIQLVNFPTQIPTVTLTVVLFFIYFFPLMLGFVLQRLSLHCEILIMLLSQFAVTFHEIHYGMLCFIAQCTVFPPLISASPLGIHIEISTSPLISATPLNVALIRIVTIFYQQLHQNCI